MRVGFRCFFCTFYNKLLVCSKVRVKPADSCFSSIFDVSHVPVKGSSFSSTTRSKLSSFSLLFELFRSSLSRFGGSAYDFQQPFSITNFIMGKTKGGFYAVARGKKVGVFLDWDTCKAQVNGFANARYKKFATEAEAQEFIRENGDNCKSRSNKVVAGAGLSLTSTSMTSSSIISPIAAAATRPTALSSRFKLNKPKGSSEEGTLSEQHFHPQVSTYRIQPLKSGSSSALSSSMENLSDSQFLEEQSKRTKEILKHAGFAVESPSPSSSSSKSSFSRVSKASAPSSFSNVAQTRNFSTTKVLDKRKLKVTEEVVVNKKQKIKASSAATGSNDCNEGVNLTDFSVDDAGYIVVYTDGACSRNGFNGAKAGIGVWFGDDHALNLSEPVRGRQTNNTAEIQAAEQAILQAKRNGINKLNVQTDSQFVINCITKWINKWKKNGWKLGTGKPVINKNDLEKLDAAMADMDIKWSYVAGHSGHYGNEAADRLAVEGANKN